MAHHDQADHESRHNSGDLALAAGLALLVLVALANAAWTLPSVVDDAWISARYARNLALGHGPVYNAGEPPIEGYTNLAFVLVTAGLYRIGADMHAAMVGVGLLCGLLGIPTAAALSRVLAPEKERGIWILGAPLLLAIDPHWAVVSTNGIESSMFATGVLTACALALSAEGRGVPFRAAAGAMCGALAWIRPEGVAVGVLLGLSDLVAHRRDLARPASWLVLGGAVLSAVPVWVGRFLYFGAWVPNTFSAKYSRPMPAQIEFNLNYLSPDAPFWMLGAFAISLGLLVPPWNRQRATAGLVALGLVAVAFRVDMWMPGGRLLLPAVAVGLCMGVARLAVGMMGIHAMRASLLFVGLGAALVVGPIPAHVRRYDRVHTALPGNGAQRAAEHLAAHAPPGATLATRDAGVFAYFVGPDVRMAELHERALTRPHPDGKDADIASYTPKNPEFFVPTVQREEQRSSGYRGDLKVWRGLTEPYVYLGRVYQHYHRYYDVYARADLNIPPLPPEIVVNRAGPEPKFKPGDPGTPPASPPASDPPRTPESPYPDLE